MAQVEQSGIPRRRLGRSGLMVPALSFGGVGIGGLYGEVPEEESLATVRAAYDQGFRYFDTSPLYLESERRIGLALEGVPRDEIVLSTKTGTHPDRRGDYSWDGTLWSVENSLGLLKTDFIDLLLVHDPVDLEPVFAPRGALEALESLREQGVIRHIGLGQRRHDFHERAITSGRFDVILTYNDYHPVRTTALETLLPLAHKHDVGVLNGSPLGHGLLVGADPDTLSAEVRGRVTERDLAATRRFYAWTRAQGVPMVAVVLQFCLRQPLLHCTLTGPKNRAELQQNLAAATMPLPPSLWEDLAALDLTAGQV